jgi:hypothetical protein
VFEKKIIEESGSNIYIMRDFNTQELNVHKTVMENLK